LFVVKRASLPNLTRLIGRQIHPQAFVIQNLENADFVSLRLCFYGDTLNKAKEFKRDTSKFIKAFKNLIRTD